MDPEVEDEGADRNSTKFDWYFWSRGAMRRWTLRVNMVSIAIIRRREVKIAYLALELHLLFICVWSVPFC